MIAFAKFYYLLFGLLTIIGGIFGFRAGSWISLVAGGLSGVLLIAAALLLSGKPLIAFVIGLVVSVMLAGRFVPAYFERHQLFPAGVMALLSIAGIVITLLAWYKR